MRSLYTILESIFDETEQLDKIDHSIVERQLMKKQSPNKYDKLWKNILAPYKLKETNIMSLSDNKDSMVIRIKLSNNLIHSVRICGWCDKSIMYPKCIQFYNGSISEYHIDLGDDFSKYDEDVYELPKELRWLFEINTKK